MFDAPGPFLPGPFLPGSFPYSTNCPGPSRFYHFCQILPADATAAENFSSTSIKWCIQYIVYGLPSVAAHGSEAAQSLKFQRSCKILRFGSSCCADTRCAKELRKSCDGRFSFRFKELRLFSRRKRAANLTFLVKFFNYFLKILRFR